MPVFRIERTKNYTIMSNYHLRDSRISLSAKGLLSQMLSLPENWDYTLSGLRAINKEGKDAIRSSLRELEQAGYLRRSQTKAPNGRFSKNEYVIYELPQKPEPTPEEEPSSCPPESDFTLSSPPSSEIKCTHCQGQNEIQKERRWAIH